jgi:RNA polymerase sigma factor (sigma-70 family)
LTVSVWRKVTEGAVLHAFTLGAASSHPGLPWVVNGRGASDVVGPDMDNEWMAQFYGCDEEAFERLYHQWNGPILRFFLRGDWRFPDAEDRTQDTFVRGFLTKEPGRARYRPERPFGPWIYAVARNVSRSGRRSSPWGSQLLSPEVEDPRKALKKSSAGLEADIENCLQTLNEQERCFLTHWESGLGELSQNEIAEVLEVGPSRVTAIKKNALTKLGTCLEQKGYR